ncbi:RluA family pseudouridine synthase [Salegentibacter flavus]|uniref:tRNA pseudouridine65 synthase n=1 Tax=Salegentibacter flavus TaxID=287099 RepID=A0A1I4ZS25_9FLAO|nr:RluA family pseudouridine synthase [Salegentibacter flavus]SFN53075.1 tRNA pseudouridine65 synthase [Salegentibacter flavus]
MKLIETHIVPAGVKDIRLQEYAVSIFKAAPTKSSIKKAIKRREIKIDGKASNTGDWVKEGQKIELFKQEIPKKVFSLKLEVLFEDDHIGVVNKPAGYPTSGNYFKTITNALPFNLKVSTEPTVLAAPQPAHRLDNPTSGLLLIAKTGDSLRKLHRDFKEKKIQKIYTALVYGEFPGEKSLQYKIEDKVSETEISLIRSFHINRNDYSFVSAIPNTGRTHQIRIHLAKAGFPIVGDKLYGKENSTGNIKGLFLSATSLKFQHPVTLEWMNIAVAPPKRFIKIEEQRELT